METKVTIKNRWDEVSIEEFMKIRELSVEDFPDELEYMIVLLEILSDKDRNFFYSLPVNEVTRCVQQIQFVRESPHGTVRDRYTINGKRYRATLNVRELSAIRYIDLATLLKDNEDNKNLPLILAVILIPEGREYNTKEYDVMETAEEIRRHFNIADAYALSLFFSTLFNALINSMQTYSIRTIRKKMKKEKNPAKQQEMKNLLQEWEHLQKNGAGCTI